MTRGALSLLRLWLLVFGCRAEEAFTSRRPTFFEDWSPCHEARGQGKTALVTGITGMLGSHVAEALLERGYEVHGVVRPRSNVRNVAAFQSKVKMVTAELTDPWRVLRLVQKLKPDFIFHFAAQAFNSLSFEQPAETLHTNLMSTLHILEAVRELKLSSRIIIAGSSTVYGASTEEWDGPVPEEAALKPVSPYGVSKAATEMLALSYARAHGLHVIVPRFFIHLAPRGVESLALHDFARQITMVERGLLSPPVLRHGDLSTRRDITDIVDSAPVVVCLGEVAPKGTVVNLGSNVSYSMQQLLQEMVRLSPSWSEGNATNLERRLRLEQDSSRLRFYDERIVMADISKVQKLTGWVPQPDIPLLLRMLLDYWRHETAFRYPVAWQIKRSNMLELFFVVDSGRCLKVSYHLFIFNNIA